MNKSDLEDEVTRSGLYDAVTAVAKLGSLPMMADRRALSKAAVKAVLDTIGKGLLRVEGRVTLTDFGSFSVEEAKPRRRYDIATGKTIEAPARRFVKFTPCEKLEEKLARAKFVKFVDEAEANRLRQVQIARDNHPGRYLPPPEEVRAVLDELSELNAKMERLKAQKKARRT